MKDLEETLKPLAMELAARASGLMEEDARKVILEAITSGDFVKHVMPSDNSFACTYIPFRRVHELQSQLKAEKAKVKDYWGALFSIANSCHITGHKTVLRRLASEALEKHSQSNGEVEK